MGLIPGSGRSPGGGNGTPLQYSCQENFRGHRSLARYSLWAWGLKKSDMTEQLSMHTCMQAISQKSSPSPGLENGSDSTFWNMESRATPQQWWESKGERGPLTVRGPLHQRGLSGESTFPLCFMLLLFWSSGTCSSNCFLTWDPWLLKYLR